jgi:hypothetical protein
MMRIFFPSTHILSSKEGNSGYADGEIYYHNAFVYAYFSLFFIHDDRFLICDRTEAWILETMGKFWVAKKINGDIASMQ